jgi:putative salt-induced outer membrane protein
MFRRSLLALAMVTIAVPALAEEEEVSLWSGKATIGYLATSGNTDNSNLNTGFELAYAPGKWTHGVQVLAIYATESNATTAEAYDVGWKSERKLSDENYLFGRLDWRKDRFSSFETQASQTLGYGRRLIDSDKYKLNLEVGAGARQSDLADGSSTSETILRGGLNFVWTLSETAEFKQGLVVEAGDDNTFSESITELSAKLVGNLVLVASYRVRHNSDVLPLTEKTDTRAALSLEYLF